MIRTRETVTSATYLGPNRSWRGSHWINGGKKGAVGGLGVSVGESSGTVCLRDCAGDAGVGGVLTV